MYPPPLAGGVYQTANVQMNLTYEWDLFGKNRAALDAAIGASQAAIADAQQARLLLSTQVTRTYLGMVRLQAQRALQQQYSKQGGEKTDSQATHANLHNSGGESIQSLLFCNAISQVWRRQMREWSALFWDRDRRKSCRLRRG
jgi:hypothetical protein